MFGRRLRDDAVAEVEDVRPAMDSAEYGCDLGLQGCAAGDKGQRIEVTLRRYASWY